MSQQRPPSSTHAQASLSQGRRTTADYIQANAREISHPLPGLTLIYPTQAQRRVSPSHSQVVATSMIHPTVNAYQWHGMPGPSTYPINSNRPPTPPSTFSPHSSPRTKPFDWGVLTPGKIHQVSLDIAPDPLSIMNGTYQQASSPAQKDFAEYVPRRPEYSGTPSIPSILFSVDGRPGPYIRDVAKGKVCIDAPSDPVLYDGGWKRTFFFIDWPGVEIDSETLGCYNERGLPLTRAELCAHVSVSICQMFIAAKNGKLKWGPQRIDRTTKQWNLHEIDYRDVRIMALNYYRKTWVPVLAMDYYYD